MHGDIYVVYNNTIILSCQLEIVNEQQTYCSDFIYFEFKSRLNAKLDDFEAYLIFFDGAECYK